MVNFKQLLGEIPLYTELGLELGLVITSLPWLVEKATNGDLSEPDWEAILEIVEEVKTKNIS